MSDLSAPIVPVRTSTLDSMKRPNFMTIAIIGIGLVGIAFYVHRRINTMQTDINKLSEATMKTVKHVSEMNVYGQQIQDLSALLKQQKSSQKLSNENTTILYEEINDVRSNLQSLVDQLTASNSSLSVSLPRRKSRKLASAKRDSGSKKKRQYDSEEDSEEADSSEDEDVSRALSRARRN